MLIKIILISLGIFVYIMIGGIVGTWCDDDVLVAFVWPMIIIPIIPYRIGKNIYKWFEEKRWKKLLGGEKNDKTD